MLLYILFALGRVFLLLLLIPIFLHITSSVYHGVLSLSTHHLCLVLCIDLTVARSQHAVIHRSATINKDVHTYELLAWGVHA